MTSQPVSDECLSCTDLVTCRISGHYRSAPDISGTIYSHLELLVTGEELSSVSSAYVFQWLLFFILSAA